jgi:hypothetical protein
MPAKTDGSLATYRWVSAVISPFVPWGQQKVIAVAPDPDWLDVIHVASGQLVLPNLYLGLQAHGLFDQVPEDFRETCEGFKILNTQRNARLRQQMLEISSALNAADISPIWLKGANNLLDQDWESSGRMMLDLDFWVPNPNDLARAELCLERLGYLVSPDYLKVSFEDSQHLAPRFREGELARIELHRCIVKPRLAELLPDAEALCRVEWLLWEGHRVGRLSLPDRMMHSYVQCAEMSGHGMFCAKVPLMKVLDFVQLAVACRDAFQADEFVKKIDRLPWRARSRQFLSYVAHDFGLTSPLPHDGQYLSKRKWSHSFPRLVRYQRLTRLFLHNIFRNVLEGRLGSPRSWWPRIKRFYLSFS